MTVIPPTFGELWPTNNTDLDVELFPSKLTFLEDHISAHRGAVRSNFYTLVNDPKLTSTLNRGWWSPQHFFVIKGQKLAYNSVY